MAVVKNFWLQDNKQKLGGAVIYQANGQTLMRQLAPSVTNPRTDAQMEQRVKLANLVAFYRASSKWMRGAFETKPSNQSDYNAFVSANASANSVYLTKSQVDEGTAVVAPYVVSRGSLGEITQVASEGRIDTNLYVGGLSINDSTTIAQFSAALINNNNGIQEGDQVSVVQYIQNTSTNNTYTITCRAYEVILSLTNGSPLAAYLPVALLGVSAGETPAISILTSSFVGGAALILSRTQGGRILVSSSSVTLTFGNSIYPAMTTNTQKQEAIKSYGSLTTVFLDSGVANVSNAEVSTMANILAVTRGTDVYTPNSSFPLSWADGDDVTFILSAPVQIPANAKITLYCADTGQSVELTPGETALLESASKMASFDADIEFKVRDNESANLLVTIPTTDGGNITASFILYGGLG